MEAKPSKTEKAIAVLKLAIQTESDGIEFYTKAVQRATDPAAKEFFGSLVAEEAEHRRLLETQLTALQTGQGWQRHRSLPAPAKRAPLFTPERLERDVDARTTYLSALRTALTIEDNAVAFYGKAAENADDELAQALFRHLTEMEQSHQAVLQREYEFLLGQFREVMGFAPF